MRSKTTLFPRIWFFLGLFSSNALWCDTDLSKNGSSLALDSRAKEQKDPLETKESSAQKNRMAFLKIARQKREAKLACEQRLLLKAERLRIQKEERQEQERIARRVRLEAFKQVKEREALKKAASLLAQKEAHVQANAVKKEAEEKKRLLLQEKRVGLLQAARKKEILKEALLQKREDKAKAFALEFSKRDDSQVQKERVARFESDRERKEKKASESLLKKLAKQPKKRESYAGETQKGSQKEPLAKSAPETLRHKILQARLSLQKWAEERFPQKGPYVWSAIEEQSSLQTGAGLEGPCEEPKTIAQLVQTTLEHSPEHSQNIKFWKWANQKRELDLSDIDPGALGDSFEYAKQIEHLAQGVAYQQMRVALFQEAKVESAAFQEQVVDQQVFGFATDQDRLAVDLAKERWEALYDGEKFLLEIRLKALFQAVKRDCDSQTVDFSQNWQAKREYREEEILARRLYEEAKKSAPYRQLGKEQIVRLHDKWRSCALEKIGKGIGW